MNIVEYETQSFFKPKEEEEKKSDEEEEKTSFAQNSHTNQLIFIDPLLTVKAIPI